MTMTMGGITIADPDVPVEGEQVFIGQQDESHDGTLITIYTNIKWKWLFLAACIPVGLAAPTTRHSSMAGLGRSAGFTWAKSAKSARMVCGCAWRDPSSRAMVSFSTQGDRRKERRAAASMKSGRARKNHAG